MVNNQELKDFIENYFDDDCADLIIYLKNGKEIKVHRDEDCDKSDDLSAFDDSIYIYQIGKTSVLTYDIIDYIECIHIDPDEKHMISW